MHVCVIDHIKGFLTSSFQKKSGESFCPDSFEIRFNHGVTWRSLFPSKRVTETATKALDYSGPSEIIFDDGTKLGK